MSDKPFTFAYDTKNRFMRIEMSGFWTRETLTGFQQEAARILQLAKVQTEGKVGGRVIVNATDFPVQDKAITDDIARLIPDFGILAKRIAIVSSLSAVQRIQARRLLLAHNSKIFENEQQAMDWLMAE